MLSTGKFDVLAMVHNETSSGVMSNLEDISANSLSIFLEFKTVVLRKCIKFFDCSRTIGPREPS